MNGSAKKLRSLKAAAAARLFTGGAVDGAWKRALIRSLYSMLDTQRALRASTTDLTYPASFARRVSSPISSWSSPSPLAAVRKSSRMVR